MIIGGSVGQTGLWTPSQPSTADIRLYDEPARRSDLIKPAKTGKSSDQFDVAKSFWVTLQAEAIYHHHKPGRTRWAAGQAVDEARCTTPT